MEDTSSNSSTKSETLCKVCGDKASGKHYGVASCDGCRGFFKRSIRRNLEYVCKENGRCVVDVTRRNQCQACRFRKCLQVNMKKDAVQHERAPRTSHQTLHHYTSPLGSRLRSVNGNPLFANLPLHLPGPPILDHASPSPSLQNPYFQHGFFYPSILAGFMKPPVFTTGMLSNNFQQKLDPVLGQRLPSVCKDDEVSSSEEASANTERNYTQEDVRERRFSLNDTQKPTELTDTCRNIRPVELSTLTMLPTENIYESAAKLLFLSVKWARTIPSFLQLSYRDQSILLEESWSELFVLTAAQWSLPIDEMNNAIAPSSRQLSLEEDARRLRDVISRLNLLRVDHTEYACLKALVLFKSESRSICDPAHIELLQDQTHVMLQEYCINRYCSHKGRFGKLLLTLPTVQAVSRRGLEELLFRKTIGEVPIERLLGDMVKASNT